MAMSYRVNNIINKFNVAGFLAILMWSITIAFARSLSENLGPLTTAMIVYLSGGIVGSIPYLYKSRYLDVIKIDKRYLYGCGALFMIYMVTIFLALDGVEARHDVVVIGLINYMWIPLTIFLYVYIFGGKNKGMLNVGLLLATFGVALAMFEGSSFNKVLQGFEDGENINSYLLAFVAAVSWAMYSVLSKRWGDESEGAVPLFMLATGVILVLILVLYVDETQRWSSKVIFELVVMSVFTNLGYVLWDLSMRKGDIGVIVPVSYSIPLLSTFVSIYYLGIQPSLIAFGGAGLVMVGAYICYISMNSNESG